MFLRAGCVPQPAWVAAVDRFMQMADASERARRAAVFRPPGIADLMRPGLGEILAMLRVTFGGAPKPEQGLVITRRFYDALGGHDGHAEAEAAMLRKLGRRRIAMLPAGAAPPR